MPVYNEVESIAVGCDKLFAVLDRLPFASEVIAVNDGSTDNSLSELQRQISRYPNLRVVDLRRNYGQTAAIMDGIDYATGELIVTIEDDVQHDHEEHPTLLEHAE